MLSSFTFFPKTPSTAGVIQTTATQWIRGQLQAPQAVAALLAKLALRALLVLAPPPSKALQALQAPQGALPPPRVHQAAARQAQVLKALQAPQALQEQQAATAK